MTNQTAQCKHCGLTIESDGRPGWIHTEGPQRRMHRCALTPYGYDAAPDWEPCSFACLGYDGPPPTAPDSPAIPTNHPEGADMIQHLEVVTTQGRRAYIVIDGEQLQFDPISVHVDRDAMDDPVVTLKFVALQVTIHPPVTNS